ncbi:hypothetical protein AAKU55_000063 [Oxalobacteraceae bacterium GrIS 1.11]
MLVSIVNDYSISTVGMLILRNRARTRKGWVVPS